MTSAQLYYLLNLLIYAGVDIIACLGLSQQFGVAGVTNFGFIIFQAAGAYTAAILSLPSDSANGGFQSYLGGWNLPFPVPWIGAAIVGGLVALPFTFLVGRRLRGDFAAVGLLVTAVMFNLLATNYRPFLNGAAGLSLVPAPLQGEYDPSGAGYQWAYAVDRAGPGGRGLPAGAAGDRVAVRALAAGHARQRPRGRLARQEPARPAHRGAGAGRRAGRAERRHPGRLHHHVVARGVGLRGDDRAVRRGDHRRRGQSPRRRPRRDPGPGGLRGGHQVPPQHVRAARLRRRPAVGRHRPAGGDLPLVPAAGDPARAPPHHRRRE